jgi:hypothetical protein
MARLVCSLTDVTDLADLNRKARAALRRYGVAKYAVFYQCDGVRYSHVIDCETRTYDFLELGPDGWRPTEGVPPMPQILLLRQGEVIRISEDSREYQLHALLDAIVPAPQPFGRLRLPDGVFYFDELRGIAGWIVVGS